MWSKNNWCKLRMMMTFMEVKGHQRSNVVNNMLLLVPYLVKRTVDASFRWWWPSQRSKVIRGQMWKTLCYGYHIWSKEQLMQAKNDDLHGGQRSSEVKCGKQYATATILSQKNRWCKLTMMMTFTKVKGYQRSNVVNYVLWLTYLVQKTTDAS